MSVTCKQLTEHNLEILLLKGGCTSSSESTLVKMSHCWKSHVAAQISSQRQKDTQADLPLRISKYDFLDDLSSVVLSFLSFLYLPQGCV